MAAMTYKSILVHVEPTDAGRVRLQAALALAGQFRARVVGVGACAFDLMPVGLSILEEEEAVNADLAAARTLFEEEISGSAIDVEWRSEAEYPTFALLRYAACADIIIAGHGVGARPPELRAGCADLIMAAGAPVISVPDAARMDWRSVLIGWKNTRETRRAVSDALPLLRLAETVQIVRFAAADEARSPDLDDLISRLELHGVRAQGELRRRTEDSVTEDLLQTAAGMNADLIVAGGYGHSRLREWALGGVTQGLLEKTTRCVLFSH